MAGSTPNVLLYQYRFYAFFVSTIMKRSLKPCSTCLYYLGFIPTTSIYIVTRYMRRV